MLLFTPSFNYPCSDLLRDHLEAQKQHSTKDNKNIKNSTLHGNNRCLPCMKPSDQFRRTRNKSRSQLPWKNIIKYVCKIIGDGKNFCFWYFSGTYNFIWFATASLVTASQAHFLHEIPISTKKRLLI